MSGQLAEIHLRTDANNLVTTAQTTRQPEQKETTHLINSLRHEACSGNIDDLAHVVTTDMLADCLTKENIKPDALMRAVTTGNIPNADAQPPFRKLMAEKHKAFHVEGYHCFHLAEWILRNLEEGDEALTFLGLDVRSEVAYVRSDPDWVNRRQVTYAI